MERDSNWVETPLWTCARELNIGFPLGSRRRSCGRAAQGVCGERSSSGRSNQPTSQCLPSLLIFSHPRGAFGYRTSRDYRPRRPPLPRCQVAGTTPIASLARASVYLIVIPWSQAPGCPYNCFLFPAPRRRNGYDEERKSPP